MALQARAAARRRPTVPTHLPITGSRPPARPPGAGIDRIFPVKNPVCSPGSLSKTLRRSSKTAPFSLKLLLNKLVRPAGRPAKMVGRGSSPGAAGPHGLDGPDPAGRGWARNGGIRAQCPAGGRALRAPPGRRGLLAGELPRVCRRARRAALPAERARGDGGEEGGARVVARRRASSASELTRRGRRGVSAWLRMGTAEGGGSGPDVLQVALLPRPARHRRLRLRRAAAAVRRHQVHHLDVWHGMIFKSCAHEAGEYFDSLRFAGIVAPESALMRETY